MEIVFFGMIVGGLFIASYIAIGTTLHEISLHKLSLAQKRHPHARRWRKRPFVTIVTQQPAKEIAKQIGYRRSNIATVPTSDADFYLTLPAGLSVNKRAFQQSVMRLNANNASQTALLLPVLSKPTSLSQMMVHFRTMLSAPLVQATSGLPVTATSDYHLISLRSKRSKKDYCFIGLRLLFSIVNVGVIFYALYVAITLQRPELLVTYLSLFSLFTIWAIGSYPYLALNQKLGYFSLFPAAIPYLLSRALLQPFFILKNR